MSRRPEDRRLGSRQANAQITENQVRVIRQMLDDGKATPRELSAIHGLSIEQIRRIGRRESWAWVSELPVITTEGMLPPATEEEKERVAESWAKLQGMLKK